MKLLLVILNREEFLDQVLSAMVEAGILGASVIESTRITDILMHEVPIFAGLRQFARKGRTHNRIILALVEDKEKVEDLVSILREENIDFEKEETGFLLLLPVEEIIGKWEELRL